MNFITDTVSQYPAINNFLVIVGTLRVFIKPAMSALHAFTNATPSNSDNALLARVENSKMWKIFLYLLDWTTSIKLKRASK